MNAMTELGIPSQSDLAPHAEARELLDESLLSFVEPVDWNRSLWESRGS